MAGAVALLPALTLPGPDPAIAIRDIAEQKLRRRRVTVLRDGPTAPAVAAYLDVVRDQAARTTI